MLWRVNDHGDITLSFMRNFNEAADLAHACDSDFSHTESSSGWVSRNRRVVISAGLEMEPLIQALNNPLAVSAKESVCRLWGINPELSLEEVTAVLKQRDPLVQRVAASRSFLQKERQ